MISVTSENIFLNPNLNEINNIIKITIPAHNEKYGDIYCRKIEFEYNIKFFD